MSDGTTTAPPQQLSPASDRAAKAWPGVIACLLATALLLFLCEWANRGSAASAARWLGTRFFEARPLIPRLLGFIFILTTLIVAMQLTGRRWLGIVLGAIPWSLLALATALKREITGDPLIPADLMLSGATMGAATEAVTLPLWPIALLLVALIAAIFADRRWPGQRPRPRSRRPWRTRLLIVVSALTCSTLLCLCAGPLADHHWIDPKKLRAVKRYTSYGLPAGFVLDLRDLGRYSCAKPQDYSAAAIAGIAAQYPAASAPAAQTAPPPSVVIIQLESLLDPAEMHLLPADVEVLPNLRAAHRQFGAVHAISAVYGGRSSNSEFEANTGMSMTLLPADCIAYEHIVRKDIPCLARVLGDHGYCSTAIVCGYANMFRYSEVYPKHMGFDRVIFANELMPEASRYDAIPDAVVLGRIAKAIEDSPGPAYVFACTGHGHAPWSAERFPKREFESFLPADLPQRQEFAGYLQGAHECDAAIGDFLQRLEKLKRPVLVFFYGDHQPGLRPELLQRAGMISGSAATTPAEILATHTTMAAFWTNVPGTKFPAGTIGLNYAGSVLLEAAAIQHPFYTGLLGKIRQHTRGIAPGLYLGLDGTPLPESPTAARADLHAAELLQYDLLAGSQHSIGPIFAPLREQNRQP